MIDTVTATATANARPLARRRRRAPTGPGNAAGLRQARSREVTEPEPPRPDQRPTVERLAGLGKQRPLSNSRVLPGGPGAPPGDRYSEWAGVGCRLLVQAWPGRAAPGGNPDSDRAF